MGKKLSDFEPLWEAEAGLVAWLQAGNREAFKVSGSVPPKDAPKALRIRAEFVRYLALGGCADCAPSEKGLGVRGAYIEGDGPKGAETRGLDLEGCRLAGDLGLANCRFPDMLLLRGAQMQSLFLNGSALMQGMGADRLEAKGSVFLRGAHAQGAVRLLEAKLGGSLSCEGARLEARESGDALNADRLDAKGNADLDGVQVHGEVRLLGAKLGGDLDCDGAELIAGRSGDALTVDRLEAKGSMFLRKVRAQGEIRLLGAKLGGDLHCDGAELKAGKSRKALNCNGAEISGSLFLRGGTEILGALVLTSAQIGRINDTPACWPTEIILDRCRYSAFAGRAPVDAAARLEWLGLQRPKKYGVAFWPQPYEECARALREAGHGGAARAILIEKERLQRAARCKELRAENRTGQAALLAVWDGILGATVRYGRAPLLAFVWLAGFWLAGTAVFGGAETFGAIKPNLPQVQRAPEWVLCGMDAGEAVTLPSLGRDAVGLRQPLQTQYGCFLSQKEALSYPQFNAGIYSADVLLPVVSLEMQSYWLPNDQNPFGVFARWYLWFQIIAGWALTLLAVAGFSGLIKQDSK